MRFEGTLSKWNDDRGFGFITPTLGGSEVFVQISASPKDGCCPVVGERLTFEVQADGAGKKRAKNLLRLGRISARSVPQAMPRDRGDGPGFRDRGGKTGFGGRVLSLVVVAALAWYGYSEYRDRAASWSTAAVQSDARADAVVQPDVFVQRDASAFRCDGRTYCSQMTSCEQATFFLRNCPNVRMDGDGDGVPCEKQWCSGFFGR